MPLSLPTGPKGRILALGILALLLGMTWLAVAAPLRALHADRAETLEQRRALAARMQALADAAPLLQRAAAATGAGPQPRALLQGASDSVAGAALQAQIEALAATSGVALSSTELLPAEASGAYRRIGLRLTVTGQWPALIRLLQGIDQSSPGMLVDDLQLQVATSVAAVASQPLAAALTVIAFRAGGAG